jgi:hypothetical protein
MKHTTMRTKMKLVLIIWALLGVGPLFAQPRADILLHQNADQTMEVLLVPDGEFTGLLSALVFTISWEGGVDNEPLLEQSASARALLPLAPCGPVHEVGGRHCRIYSGIGFTTLAEAGQHWRADQSWAVAAISAPPGAKPMLDDNSWVKDRRNNGAYYLSLNGLSRTGKVRSVDHSVGTEGSLSIHVGPNPSQGELVVVEVHGAVGDAVSLEVLDARGRVTHSMSLTVVDGSTRMTLDVGADLTPGAYAVTVRAENAEVTTRLVISGR